MQGTSLAGRSILVVEDEPLIALDLQQSLQEMGAAVLTAHTPTTALELAQRHELSAAIVDFQLGEERCDGLCAELSQRGVPFMFFTGGTEHRLHNSDAPVVTKPASMEAIVTVLQSLIAAVDNRKARKPQHSILHLF